MDFSSSWINTSLDLNINSHRVHQQLPVSIYIYIYNCPCSIYIHKVVVAVTLRTLICIIAVADHNLEL
jgi:hypothetical protein